VILIYIYPLYGIMMLQLLSTRRHVITYWPNLRSVVRHFISVTTDDAAILAPAAVRSGNFVSTDSNSTCKSIFSAPQIRQVSR